MKKVATSPPLADDVHSALKWLEDHSTEATPAGMARYAIPSDHALGAVALWETGV